MHIRTIEEVKRDHATADVPYAALAFRDAMCVWDASTLEAGEDTHARADFDLSLLQHLSNQQRDKVFPPFSPVYRLMSHSYDVDPPHNSWLGK